MNVFDEILKELEDSKNTCEGTISTSDKIKNIYLKHNSKTRYSVGDTVSTNMGEIVIIKEVQPKGYISMSSSKNYLNGSMLPPVTCNEDIYVYERQLDGGTGQTTEKNLIAISDLKPKVTI